MNRETLPFLDELFTFPELIQERYNAALEGLIKKVLSVYLEREITIHDAKDIMIGQNISNPNERRLSYDNTFLGTIIETYKDGVYTFTFNPAQ